MTSLHFSHTHHGANAVDMTKGAIWPILVSFTIPLLLGNLFQLLYNTVDSVVVGNCIGRSAFAAISATTQICGMLVRFFNGTAVGASAVISRHFGAKDREKLHQAIHTTMALTLIACVGLTALGVGAADWMLRCMSTPEEVFPEASIYLHIYFGGIGGLLIYNMGSSILRAVGDTKRPLIFLLVCSGLNIALDLLFVIVFPWGIAGVAIATILSQFISAGLVLYVLTTTQEECRVDWRELKIDRRMAADILRVGLPVGLQMAIVAFSNVFVQAYINAFDTACIAGWGCFTKLDQYMMLPTQSMGQAATTFVGQNLGAKQPQRARQGTWQALLITLGVSTGVAVVLWVLARPLTALFIPDEETVAFGALFLRLCSPFAILCCFNQVYSGALRGAGDSQGPMLITLCSHVLLRQIYLMIITRVLPNNVYAVGFGYPFGWIMCAIFMTVYYKLRHWDRAFQDK